MSKDHEDHDIKDDGSWLPNKAYIKPYRDELIRHMAMNVPVNL